MSRYVTILCALVWALLTGCVPDLISERPPERIYWLEPVTLNDPPAIQVRVSVVPGLDTDRLWLLEPDQRLNFYAGAHWPDRLQPLLQSLISRSLPAAESGRRVDVLIERFFAVVQAGEEVPRIDLVAELRTPKNRCRIARSRPAAGARLRDIVAGHQALVNDLVESIAAFGRSGRCP